MTSLAKNPDNPMKQLNPSLAKKYSVLVLFTLISAPSAFAENGGKNEMSESERAHAKAQVEALQKSKLQAAATAKANNKNAAIRQGQSVDEKVRNAHEIIDKQSASYSWIYGPEAAQRAGTATKQAVNARAAAEKQKIIKDAIKKAAVEDADAKRNVANINKSVEGLKSQVAKRGSYGLQPKGSSIYVRNYGK